MYDIFGPESPHSGEDVKNVTLEHRQVPEEVAFGASCPASPLQAGYVGDCGGGGARPGPDLDPQAVVDGTWNLRARARTDRCRSELTQIFCAYRYSHTGTCLPPFMAKRDHPSGGEDSRIPTTGPYLAQSLFPRYRLKQNRTAWAGRDSASDVAEDLRDLLPVQLGFAILAHQDPEAVLQLLDLVYRPDLHFYAIYIDSGKAQFRKALSKALASGGRRFGPNLKIVPETSSRPASWGSWGLTYGLLAAYEELQWMGKWDHAVSLSGSSDLPLRTTEDLAVALAPYRGISFMSLFPEPKKGKNSSSSSSSPTGWTFWACDDYLFKVTTDEFDEDEANEFKDSRFGTDGDEGASEVGSGPSSSEAPDGEERSTLSAGRLKSKGASQWTVLSWEAVSVLLDQADHPDQWKRHSLHFLTRGIPDEKYIPSLIASASSAGGRRKGLRVEEYRTHFINKFQLKDKMGLCRHTLETDLCGRGPKDLTVKQSDDLAASAVTSFFARKFGSSESAEGAFSRRLLLSGLKRPFEAPLLKDLDLDLLMRLAHRRFHLAVKNPRPDEIRTQKTGEERLRLLGLQVVPKLVRTRPECLRGKGSSLNRSRREGVESYSYILQFQAMSPDDKVSEGFYAARMTFEPPHRCFADKGDLIFARLTLGGRFQEGNTEGFPDNELQGFLRADPPPVNPPTPAFPLTSSPNSLGVFVLELEFLAATRFGRPDRHPAAKGWRLSSSENPATAAANSSSSGCIRIGYKLANPSGKVEASSDRVTIRLIPGHTVSKHPFDDDSISSNETVHRIHTKLYIGQLVPESGVWRLTVWQVRGTERRLSRLVRLDSSAVQMDILVQRPDQPVRQQSSSIWTVEKVARWDSEDEFRTLIRPKDTSGGDSSRGRIGGGHNSRRVPAKLRSTFSLQVWLFCRGGALIVSLLAMVAFELGPWTSNTPFLGLRLRYAAFKARVTLQIVAIAISQLVLANTFCNCDEPSCIC